MKALTSAAPFALVLLLLPFFPPIFARSFSSNLSDSAFLLPRLYSPHSSQLSVSVPSWDEITSSLEPCLTHPLRPNLIDSARETKEPSYNTDRPTLYRERHGWCPYSERVWLTLELSRAQYDTVLIDNTGHGPRPNWFGGQTPQIRWESGRVQGESLDIVEALDEQHGGPSGQGKLYPPGNEDRVKELIRQFRNVFPSKARPSSRAAFLFGWSGDPLFRTEFEGVLSETDALLGEGDGGPFFCGSDLTAADVAWAPFLERYGAQLPCLHEGLDPKDGDRYPNLKRWYDAMDNVPAYYCRIKGDNSSWRKVLTMAGYGNAGVPPVIRDRMESQAEREGMALTKEQREMERRVWDAYASERPYVAPTAGAEASSVIARNRDAIYRDVRKRIGTSWETEQGLPMDDASLDEAMRAMAYVLLSEDGLEEATAENAKNVPGVGSLASFLDERMCVPRDMGCPSAGAVKRLAFELSS